MLTGHSTQVQCGIEYVKCISEHVVKLVSGVEDSVKVWSEEKDRMRFPLTWSTQVPVGAIKKTVLPAAPFRLSKVEMKIANQWAMNIRTPHGTERRYLAIKYT